MVNRCRSQTAVSLPQIDDGGVVVCRQMLTPHSYLIIDYSEKHRGGRTRGGFSSSRGTVVAGVP